MSGLLDERLNGNGPVFADPFGLSSSKSELIGVWARGWFFGASFLVTEAAA